MSDTQPPPAKPTPEHPIAYFSAEYAIENNLPIYAGGLGVLAADLVLEAGEEGVPMVAFGVMYACGFDAAGELSGRLDPIAAGFDLIKDASGQTMTAKVACNDHIVLVQAWQRTYGSARLILLDTDNPDNNPQDQLITAHLYDTNYITELSQEMVVGLAAIDFMHQLGISPSVYHVNEGHTCFVIIGLLIDYLKANPGASLADAQAAVRTMVVATKHTILPGAGLFVERLVFRSVVGAALAGTDVDAIFQLGTTAEQPEHFSATKFILNQARDASGVSKLHVASEKALHPKSRLETVTNGVHRSRWLAHSLKDHDGLNLNADELWNIHSSNRSNLVATVNDLLGSHLDANTLTVVWARRMAAYKRPALLFNNLLRLEALVTNTKQPIQFIIAGKANSGDEEGKRILEEILKYCSLPKLSGRIVYLPGYSIPTTSHLVAGADLWLNTPVRGQEACGTSGMKASLNGALQLSTSDGWIDEVSEDCIGWKLPEENIQAALYDYLEQKVAPLFYKRDANNLPIEWINRMHKSMVLINERFTAQRMLSEYMSKLYFPVKNTR